MILSWSRLSKTAMIYQVHSCHSMFLTEIWSMDGCWSHFFSHADPWSVNRFLEGPHMWHHVAPFCWYEGVLKKWGYPQYSSKSLDHLSMEHAWFSMWIPTEIFAPLLWTDVIPKAPQPQKAVCFAWLRNRCLPGLQDHEPLRGRCETFHSWLGYDVF